MPEEEPRIEDPAAPSVEAPAPSKTTITPVMALAFLVVLLVAVLIVMKSKRGEEQPPDDVTGLQAKVSAMQSELNRERMAMGLSPLPSTGGVDSLDEIAGRLKKDADTLVSLAGSFQGMLAEKDALLTAKGEELLRSEQLRQALASESSRLNNELQRALVSGSDVDLLRRDLGTVKAQRDAVSAELAAARQQIAAGNAGSSADSEDLRRKLDETRRAKEFFESRVRELEAELAKSRLFAKSESELLPAAVELFRTLRQLEGVPDSELMTSYSNLGIKLGANVMHTLPFATGSSALAPEDDSALRRLTGETPDGDLILVIGYASETGNVDANARLSSDRATAAAEMISGVKRPGQLVQAVYLGQTDRFSSRIPERNQLCEVWRIRKQ